VGPELLTPGSASREKTRSVGSASLSDASAGRPARSVASSAGTAASSAASSRANAPAVMLKSVTRLLSASGSALRARKVRAWPRNTRWTSRLGSWPSVASFASAELR
jgi:hypothetical protein